MAQLTPKQLAELRKKQADGKPLSDTERAALAEADGFVQDPGSKELSDIATQIKKEAAKRYQQLKKYGNLTDADMAKQEARLSKGAEMAGLDQASFEQLGAKDQFDKSGLRGLGTLQQYKAEMAGKQNMLERQATATTEAARAAFEARKNSPEYAAALARRDAAEATPPSAAVPIAGTKAVTIAVDPRYANVGQLTTDGTIKNTIRGRIDEENAGEVARLKQDREDALRRADWSRQAASALQTSIWQSDSNTADAQMDSVRSALSTVTPATAPVAPITNDPRLDAPKGPLDVASVDPAAVPTSGSKTGFQYNKPGDLLPSAYVPENNDPFLGPKWWGRVNETLTKNRIALPTEDPLLKKSRKSILPPR